MGGPEAEPTPIPKPVTLPMVVPAMCRDVFVLGRREWTATDRRETKCLAAFGVKDGELLRREGSRLSKHHVSTNMKTVVGPVPRRNAMARAPGIAHPIPFPYGAFREFVRDPLEFQLRAREKFGDVFRFRIGPLVVHFLYHPDHVRRVLYEQQKNFVRGWQYQILRRLLGDNLVVSEGDYWLRQRRLAQPAFHRQRLNGYADTMVDSTANMLTRWRDIASAGETVDVGVEMSRLALAIASRTLFDRDVSGEADTVGTAFAVTSRYLERRFNHPFTSPPLWVPSSANRRFQAAIRTLNEIALGIVQERRLDNRDHGDLLTMLMHATDEETGATMTDDQLRSEVLTFLLAGTETTATALTWTWYLLASHPAIQKQVRDEVSTVIGDRLPTVADVPQLTTTRAVIEESMRLYPPIWAVARQAVHADEVGGFVIPAGSTVILSPFVTHRHPDVWDDPTVFNPDRFTPDRVAQRPKAAYFPFLGGAHQCIGIEFAMLEMRLVVAMILQSFALELPPNHTIRPTAGLAIRPSEPVRVILRTRASV
jgi:cytochrome P450